jgi:hypothetical protein
VLESSFRVEKEHIEPQHKSKAEMSKHSRRRLGNYELNRQGMTCFR